MRKAALSFILLFIAAFAQAQETQPEMADAMRSNGKIYVVVLVLATIFAGIVAYLVRLDRKITKIEKNS
ncbi:CcmD family protein [Polluticoccus soli]|uniref:CcmD family protein n=1 Tax=Polluticoccus soli TaxID=3034150 RepID=UPI0023E13F48|nr:CcmD family protein [Flavipsychrobacter sp. JY13-12]